MGVIGIFVMAAIVYLLVKVIKSSSIVSGQSTRQGDQPTQPVQVKNQQASNIKGNPVDEFASNPHYAQAKRLLDEYDPLGRQPKYKIELLLQSMDAGLKVDFDDFDDTLYYLGQSINKNLPYFCESEYEFNKFFDGSKPVLRGSIQGIVDLMGSYIYGPERKHPGKAEYWKRRLRELADSGNLEAQAVLCTNRVKHAFSERELLSFKEKFEADLRLLAESGDAGAQLAVGEFLTQQPPQKIEWLTKAAQQGLSDAWCELGLAYESMINIDDDGQFHTGRLSETEVRRLMEKKAECFLKGAEANNGIMAAWCQYKSGDYYADGDLFPRDFAQAAYWYQKALENGEESARSALEYVGAKLSEQ